MKCVTKNMGNECIGTRERDFGAVQFCQAYCLSNGHLSRCGIREDVPFNEQPFGILNAPLLHMPRRQMAGDGQARAHGALRIGCDQANVGTGRFIYDDWVTNINSQLFEFAGVKDAVTIIAHASDKGCRASEL